MVQHTHAIVQHTLKQQTLYTQHVSPPSHFSCHKNMYLLVMVELNGGPTFHNFQGVPPTLDQDLCNTSMCIQQVHSSVSLIVVVVMVVMAVVMMKKRS